MFDDGEVPDELKDVEISVTLTISESIDLGLGLQAACEVYRAAGMHEDADRAFAAFLKVGHEVEPHLRKYAAEKGETTDPRNEWEWPEQ
jgi:hypothetical protein